jgi:hypothetical protein
MKKRKTDNTKPNENEKDRQYNSKMKKRKTDNTIAK